MFRLKLAAEIGGAEADPVTEMLVLERLAYHDLTSGWCTMVGATGDCLARHVPAAGRPRSRLRRRPRPDRVDLFLSRRPCGARRRRLSHKRALALQQRHSVMPSG